jgi:hypothetical protein
MTLLIPTWLDLCGWAGVLAVAASFIGLGRIMSAGRAAPETALVAGWGAAVLLLTLWGVVTPASLRYPGVAVLTAGFAALAVPGVRLSRSEWLGIARIIGLALPLFAVLASARPSEPDTFLNLLPNLAYLHDHAAFPADGRPPAHSYLPAAPYNLQLAGFLANLLTPDFAANALIAFNLVLQLAAALLLARLVGRADGTRSAPSWGASALGLLAVTAFNPGFVPRFHLSSYSEASVTVALAFAGCEAVRLLDRTAKRGAAGGTLVALALTLAALVNIKQDSVALAVAVIATAAALALASAAPRRTLAALAVAAIPAAALYLAWRWYVLAHIPEGELAPLPLALWQPSAIPIIVENMLAIMGEKLVFFAVLAATLAAGAWRWRRRGLDRSTRTAALLGGVFVLYNAALLFAYVAHFRGSMGQDAHSYFRYSTHLSLLLMLAIMLLLRAEARERGWQWRPRLARWVPAALVALMLVAPVAFLHFLRFDLEVPALRVWQIAGEAAPNLGDNDRLALLLPGDNGSVAPTLETVLRTVPPRHPALALTLVKELAPDTLDRLAAEGYGVALLTCAPVEFAGIPAGAAGLLRHDQAGWHAVRTWRYGAPPAGARWSHVLADAPLCLAR